MKLNDNYLKSIIGGGISASLINAASRGISLVLELGRSVGSAIRRFKTGRLC